MNALQDAHGALSSICAALKGNEYLGDDSRKRLLFHAASIRRGLEIAERSLSLPEGWTVKGLISVCCVCVQRGDVPAPPDDLRTDGYCALHEAEMLARIQALR